MVTPTYKQNFKKGASNKNTVHHLDFDAPESFDVAIMQKMSAEN